MAYSPSSPVTGTAQTGLASPTYTLTAMPAPDVNGIQHAVTALGGTQTGVSVHSASSPFTVTFVRPKVLKTLGPLNSNGQLRSVPRNSYKLIVRKGVNPLASQPVVPAMLTVTWDIPAGSDLVDPEDLRAMCSVAFGLLSQQSAGIGDSVVSGV